MEQTNLCKIPYPSDNDDPYFDGFVEMMVDIDQKIFGLLSSAGNIIMPPPNVVWNSSTKVFSWDDDFVVNILSSGKRFFVRFGPDNATRQIQLNDGDKVIITIPTTSNTDVVGKFSVVTGAVAMNPGVFVFGIRHGNKFFANLPVSV